MTDPQHPQHRDPDPGKEPHGGGWSPTPPGPGGAPAYGADPYAAPGAPPVPPYPPADLGYAYGPAPGTGYPPPGPSPAYPPGPYGAPYRPQPPTNGLAVAALVVSLSSLVFCGLYAFVGAIMGHMAQRQIRESGEQGKELALTAVIVGWAVTALIVVGLVVFFGFFVVAARESTYY